MLTKNIFDQQHTSGRKDDKLRHCLNILPVRWPSNPDIKEAVCSKPLLKEHISQPQRNHSRRTSQNI